MKNGLPLILKGALLLALLLLTACNPPAPVVAPATPQAIQSQIKTSKAPLTLVHVWATWCDPCREEFPELMHIYNNFKDQGLELILISADEPSDAASVETFLTEHQCPVGSLISTELSQTFIETLSPKWAGSLPSSFFYSKGRLLAEWEGKRNRKEYTEQINALLKP